MTYQQTWGPVTVTGPLPQPINYRQFGAVPSAHTVDWFNDHTAPAAATFQVEGSSDGIHWYALTDSTDFTAPSMIHIVNKPVMWIRINILSYTQGDTTTAVSFHYTGTL